MHLDWLFERMGETPDQAAVVWREQAITYGTLLAARDAWEHELDRQQIGAGHVVAILGDYSPNAIALLLALIDRGVVIVPLTDATLPQHPVFLELSEATHQVTFAADDTSTFTVLADAGSVTHPLIRDVVDRGVPGLIVFSSGSTGVSKGMVHDLSRTLQKFVTRRQPLVTMAFLLFDHMGGINTLLHTLSNNGTVVATERREPDAVCALVAEHRVELLPVSPTFLGLLMLSGAHRRHDVSSLRLVTYGTEVMPQATLDRASRELPDVEFRQTYGLSETGALRTKSRDNTSTWLKVGGEGVETKIVDGTLWVRSPWAVLGYLNAPNPFDADGWLNTQDRVEVDGDYIRFLGRETDIINVGGNKVYPAEVESVLMELDNIEDAEVFGDVNALLGFVVAARVVLAEPEPTRELTKRIRTHVAARLERFKVPARVEVIDATSFSVRYKKVRGRPTDS